MVRKKGDPPKTQAMSSASMEAGAAKGDPATRAGPETPEPGKPRFPVVGLGASAGGLAAFEAFFSGMPTDRDPGMAFVLVQHLAPDHNSILAELIRRCTRMQVFEVADGLRVEPNCAYIIPPGRDMAIMDGALYLFEPSAPRGKRLPIDFFFQSLAHEQRDGAIAIVLSGTGCDGTHGIRAIKEAGGMVMAQDPASTEFDGMPRSAVATGLVDYTVVPGEMANLLISYKPRTRGSHPRAGLEASRHHENALQKIFLLLRARTGHDFSKYKANTIHRRIARRLAVHQIDTIDGYASYLTQTPGEAKELFRDLLIGVTSFFRDPDAFHVLETRVIPKLFEGKAPGSALRLWSPGCSTGEEAYSLAILMQERIELLKQNYKVQIFATDIDDQAIASARTGAFPVSISADLTPDRLSRFFTLEADGSAYRIHKVIRDMMIFSEQDLIMDPPFSRLDLISCRNLLIYMEGHLQKKIIPLFHYALNPGGFLFQGSSESVGEYGEYFAVVDRKAKVYQRTGELHNAPFKTLAITREPSVESETSRTPAPRATTQELETSNEELKSSNEEMQSVNEELQSTNEELETSKEELQSVNEELATVNAELQIRVADLSRANNDMNNLFAGTSIGTIFVDQELRILRFTPAATRITNLIPGDIGRPVGHIVSNLIAYDRLVVDCQEVLDTLVPKALEVQTREGKWYTLRIQLYRTLNNVIEGAVITFIDITEMKHAETALRESESLFRQLAASLPQLVWTSDPDGVHDYLSPQWVEFTGIPEAEQLGLKWMDQIHPEDRSRLRTEWGKAVALGEPFDIGFRLRHHSGDYHDFDTHASAIRNPEGCIVKWFGLNTDITGRKPNEKHGLAWKKHRKERIVVPDGKHG